MKNLRNVRGFASYMRKLRENAGLSISAVVDRARKVELQAWELDLLEQGHGYLTVCEFRELARIYRTPVIDLMIHAGILSRADVNRYSCEKQAA